MIVLLAACRPSGPPASVVVGAEAVADPDFPTVVTVTWASTVDGTSEVEVLRDGVLDHVTPASDTPEVTVLGLAGGADYALVPVQVARDGTRYPGAPIPVTIAPPPDGLPRWAAATDGETDPAAFVLLSLGLGEGGWVAVLDRRGDWVWWWSVPDGMQVVIAEPSRDGASVVALETDMGQDVDVASFVRIPVRGGPASRTPTTLAHHDLAELPDGRVSWLSYDLRTVEIDGEALPLRSERVLEADEGGDGAADEVFAVFDDYPRDPFFPCEHALRTDGSPIGDAHDWTHGNSLVWSEPVDALYVHARYLDALWKLDRATGALLWQMGGLDGDFAVDGGGPLWSHGHTSQVWEGGMTMFDNGDHATPRVSAAVEYAWDEASFTVGEVWRFPHPEGRFVGVLGDVKRLSDGNRLVAWGDLATLHEVTDAGVTVWSASGPADIVGRATALVELYTLLPSGPF